MEEPKVYVGLTPQEAIKEVCRPLMEAVDRWRDRFWTVGLEPPSWIRIESVGVRK